MIDIDILLQDLVLPDFRDQDLCTPSNTILYPPHLPVELVDQILQNLFNNYLATFNFDLACDLLLVSDRFRRRQYYLIYGDSVASGQEKYYRLIKTFGIISNIHDSYMLEPVEHDDPAIRLVASKLYDLQPWDYDHDLVLVPNGDDRYLYDDYFGLIFTFGDIYGESCQVLATPSPQGYIVHKVYTPVITLILSDVFDVINQTPKSLGSNPNFKLFCNLFIKIYGPHTSVSFMVQEDSEIINPFIIAGDIIMTL